MWERVCISDGDVVEFPVVDYWSFRSILLSDEEDGSGGRTAVRASRDHACFSHALQPFFEDLVFCLAEVVGFSRGWEFGVLLEMDFKVIARAVLWALRHGIFRVEDI